MGIATTLHGRVLATLDAACAGEDRRRVRSLGWLVTGILLEQDARLGRIALAMGSAASAASRQGQFMPDEMTEGGADDERRQLRAFYHRLGLVPGEQWIPPGSFEERNRMWWLPGNIKRYMPRLLLGDPPMIWGRGKE